MKRKKLILAICITVVASFLLSGCSLFGPKKLDIKDEKLKEALIAQIGKLDGKDITVADVESLTSLNLSNKELTDLIGIQQIEKLQILDISNNELTNIDILENMTELTSLNVQGNQISDFSKLAKLPKLKELKASVNDISEISKFKDLKNITKLEVTIVQPEKTDEKTEEQTTTEENKG